MNADLPEDQLEDYLADAVAETYHQDDLEVDRDPEARHHLLHDLNRCLDALGLSARAGWRPWCARRRSVAVALREFPDRVRKGAPERPDSNDPDHWGRVEQGWWLLNWARLHGQE